MTGTGLDPADLSTVLAHRRWVRRSLPFPHVVAQNVFVPAFYDELERHFEHIKQAGLFQKNIRNYDAGSVLVRDHADGPLGIFVSRPWHDLVAGLFGVRATGDVTAGLHHHPPGGRAGWPHNDLNPGWFGGGWPEDDEIRHEGVDDIDYQLGPTRPGSEGRETVRGVSVLFYLDNPDWRPGDGGETGIYPSSDAVQRGTGIGVPPVNNSLVMFESTPFTWHGYAGHSRHERNSVVMWVHRRKSEAVQRWGEQSIAYW
ncbi:2OG-Fe(II) oxygenase [Nocardioides hwasunensis]|uniref:2OG-Fe(II) oxygenase n=1 Tax=Nocardioides hwasunensis TaxID=397258 RepID=A0ABR8MHI9_9ACTN|nr:2OG-Fe(II) oxygenase [Nocardioides hwasunensis]MBD3915537.1 2OG-Fe(II) oxygenase [Nocardioides hwasunensis]